MDEVTAGVQALIQKLRSAPPRQIPALILEALASLFPFTPISSFILSEDFPSTPLILAEQGQVEVSPQELMFEGAENLITRAMREAEALYVADSSQPKIASFALDQMQPGREEAPGVSCRDMTPPLAQFYLPLFRRKGFGSVLVVPFAVAPGGKTRKGVIFIGFSQRCESNEKIVDTMLTAGSLSVLSSQAFSRFISSSV